MTSAEQSNPTLHPSLGPVPLRSSKARIPGSTSNDWGKLTSTAEANTPFATWLTAPRRGSDAVDLASVMDTGDLSPMAGNLSPTWATLLPLDEANRVSGEPIALRGQVVRIGRGQDNDVVISHSTVSRYHAKLHPPDQHGALMVEDVGSNNGTFLNQVRIEQPTLARHQDELKLGQVIFRLHISSGISDEGLVLGDLKITRERSHVSAPGFQKGVVGQALDHVLALSRRTLLLAVVITAALIALVVYRHRYFSGQQQQLAFANYLNVLQAVGKGDIDGAKSLLRKEVPFQRKHVLLLQADQQIAGVEAQQAKLRQAEQALEQQDYEQARLLAQELLEGFFFEEAQGIEYKVESWIELNMGTLQTLLDNGHWSEAKTLMGQLAPMCQGRADFAEMQITLDMGMARARRREQQKSSGTSQLTSGTKRLMQAITAMQQGEMERALLAITASDGPEQILEVATDTANWLLAALEAHRAKRHLAALRLLEQVEQHLGQLGIGSQSPVALWVQRSKADMLYLSGMEAVDHERFAEAFRAFREVLQRYPNHVLAKQQLERLRMRAANMASAAHASERLDKAEARRLWLAVLELLTPQDPLYRRATSHLKELD